MTHVVCEPCRDCKYTDCVTVCPVDCFYQDDQMLYIDPEECIDCGACVPECPVEAIFDEAQLPEHLRPWIKINLDKASKLPVITDTEERLPTALERKKELGFG